MSKDGKRVGRVSGAALTLTLLLVNAAAMWGQAGWALSHIAPHVIPDDWRHAATFGIFLAVGFAVAIEGVGTFLALSADEADAAGLPSGGIRLASYAVGFFVSGGLNLSHWGFESAGFAFAFLSAISPFLRGVRARIRRGGVVAPSRRLWHPLRSIALIRAMAWEGIATEELGIAFLNGKTRAVEGFKAAVASGAPPAVISAPPVVATVVSAAPDAKLRRAVESLQAGMTPAEAAELSGLSVPYVRNYATVVRTLAANPSAEIAPAAMRRVNPAVVDGIRTWAIEENAK